LVPELKLKMDEIDNIKQAMTALEAQRSTLGDQVVETALAPLQARLTSLLARQAAEQRKLVTVLFADLVGFTAMSEHLDPEDVREITNAYFVRWKASIEKAGGQVEKFIGDAVMAVFGLSHSQEDDPERAIQAALEMRLSLPELNVQLDRAWGVNLAMRVGIHTGTVMVSYLGDNHDREFIVIGDAVNLTSRLQSIAPSGGILISQDTYRHVRGSFEVQTLDPVQIKGKQEPIQAYLVLRAKRRTFHGPTRGVEGIETRLIGRDSELAVLKEALLAAIETRKTQILTVVGEAGVGKSRLLAEFDHWVELQPQQQPQAKPPIRYFKGRASPDMQNMPYSLLRDLFSYSFQIYDSDPPPVVQAKFERGIGEFEYGDRGAASISSKPGAKAAPLHPETQMRAHYIGQLLGFRFENSPYLRDAHRNPQIFWDRTLTYLVDYSKALLASGPVTVLLEDIHWADDASLDILEQIWERLANESLLVVCTARPSLFENHPDWGKEDASGKLVIKFIHLASLSQHNSQDLVDEILQKVADIPETLRDLIVAKAEGNPFFIEELIKMLIEEQVILNEGTSWRVNLSHLAGIRIPSTLVEVLQARLDSLSQEERVLLQRASVLGRVFWDDALSYMEKGQEDQAQISAQMTGIMSTLNAKEMVFTHPVSTFEDTHEYYFIHALLRDVTYDNVLKRLRKIYHGYAAAWLETITEQSHRSDEYAALIAEHYHRADDPSRARTWYQRAGDLAADTYANSEAIRCLSHCLELWPADDPAGKFELILRRAKVYDILADRPAQKADLEALTALAETLDAERMPGNAAPGVGSAKAGAHAEAGEHTAYSYQVRIFLQWWSYNDAMGESQVAMAAAHQAKALAKAEGDRESETLANMYLGGSLWRRSEFPEAAEYLGKALVLARSLPSPTMEADALRQLGIVHQYQGDFSAARQAYETAIQTYRATGNEKGESMALNSLGSLHVDQGLYQAALAFYKGSLELKRKIGHRFGEHLTLFNMGVLADRMGSYLEAIDYLKKMEQFGVETGGKEEEADALNGLGSVYLHLGDFVTARACLERAMNLAMEVDNESSQWDALQGLGILAHTQGDDATAYWLAQGAMALARKHNLALMETNSLFNLGLSAIGLGRTDEAVEHFQLAHAQAQTNPDPRPRIEIQASLAQARLARGELLAAQALVEEVISALAGKEQGETGIPLPLSYDQLAGLSDPFEVLLNCCRVQQAAAGPRTAAEPYSPHLLSESQRLLQEQAGRLPAGPIRQAYLHNIPSHRALLALAAASPPNGDSVEGGAPDASEDVGTSVDAAGSEDTDAGEGIA